MIARTEFKRVNQNHSANPVALFCPSLQDSLFDKLLEDKGSLQKVLEYVMLDKDLTEDVREGLRNVLRPRFVKHLCDLVVKDKKAETSAMLEMDPELMFVENEEPVRDHVKRIIPGSAYRIAWGAKAHTMLTIMDSFIDKVSNGRQLASDEYKKQFPDTKLENKQNRSLVSETKTETKAETKAEMKSSDRLLSESKPEMKSSDWLLSETKAEIKSGDQLPSESKAKMKSANQLSSEPTEKKPFYFGDLVKAFTADEMKDKKPNAKTTKELQKFRDYFNPEGKVIESGNHFDEESFKKVMEIGRQNFIPWNLEVYYLFSREVIGFFQRLLPACDFLAMIKQGGIVLAVYKNESVPDGDISLIFEPDGELGFNCYIDIDGFSSRGGCGVWGGSGGDVANRLFSDKEPVLEELRQRLQNPNASRSLSL